MRNWIIAMICVVLMPVAFLSGFTYAARMENFGSAQSSVPTTQVVETTVETTTEPAQYTTECTTIPTEPPTEPTEPPTEPPITAPTEPTELIKDAAYMGIDPLEYAPNGMTNLELLACVIYQEAGWDRSCDTCRALVGDVVLNRVLSPNFPNTIYEVLMQTSQYGSYCVTGVKWSDEAKYDQEGVERAWHIAKGLLKGDHTFAFEQGYVWQARFVQGKGGFWCHGTYFGYS